VQRIEKVLEDTGIKLSSVASDIVGVSGRLMLQALIDGQGDPTVIAELAQRRAAGEDPRPDRSPDRPVHHPPRVSDQHAPQAHR